MKSIAEHLFLRVAETKSNQESNLSPIKALIFLFFGIVAIFHVNLAAAGEWNAVRDFSTTGNPVGDWSYGWSNTPGGVFNQYTHESVNGACPDIDQWFEPIAADPAPYVAHSRIAAASCGPFVDLNPDELMLHPGPQNQNSVLRWIAPYSGLANVSATFVGRAVAGTTTDVHVYHEGVSLFDGNVNGSGIPTSFETLGLPVVQGDTVDFTVGYGNNGNYLDDTTALTVIIQLRDHWDAADDFSVAGNPVGDWSYGWSNTPGGVFNQYTHESVNGACPDIDQWFEPIAADPAPYVAHSRIASASCGPFVDLNPDELMLHPGPQNQNSVLRWIAPYSGLANVSATFVGRAVAGTTTDVHVYHEGVSLFDGNVNGSGIPTSFKTLGLPVVQGDTVDFTVGYGNNGNYLDDTTALTARIDVGIPSLLSDPVGIDKCRYVSFLVPQSSAITGERAIEFTLASLMHPDPPNLPQFPAPDFHLQENTVRYVGTPGNCQETESPPTNFKCASLQCTPVYMDWEAALSGQTLHVTGQAFVPSSTYEVRQLAASCRGDEANCVAISAALTIRTQRWGDVAAAFQAPSPAPLTQPNISDVAACVDKFKGVPTAIIVARADVNPAVPNERVDIADVANIVDAFKNLAYPFPGPVACP